LALAGVAVDASGVLKVKMIVDHGSALMRKKIAEARSTLSPDAARASELRKVSLPRLEAALNARLERGEPATDEMRSLAGLTRIKYVLLYPETKDIVLAGPAEGWMADPAGRMRGIHSFKPIVELQDLVVAMRAFPPGGKETPLIGCSIDATPQGLANLSAYLRSVGGNTVLSQPKLVLNNMREKLGMQVVTVHGVPPTTHFAQVLVEADYRMKLIGIGLEKPEIRLASWVSMANFGGRDQNAMQRWYFVPEYACLRVSEDKMAMELVGDGVKLVGEDEVVMADGRRVASDRVDAASRRFTQGFTAKYPELSARTPVYAQLRNAIDMAVAAAFMQQQDYYGQIGWTMDVFKDESKFAVQTGKAPERVESAVNCVAKGKTIGFPIGGGVHIKAQQALSAENLLPDENSKVRDKRTEITVKELAPGQWWWD
jgi:hypothetical protein